jgi:NtrC-family two-component system sensor histidine kinase KinB
MTLVLLVLVAAAAGAAVASVVVHRRASAALTEARSDAERVLANASDAVIACGADGVTITAWNPAAEALFGWPAAEVLGQQLPTVGDDDVEQERLAILERVRQGERVSVVTRRVHRDGHRLDVRINYSAIPGPDGSFAGWMGTVTDVTEELAVNRERAERAELVERLNAVVADINAELDVSAVLDRLANHAAVLCAADGAGLTLVDDASSRVATGVGMLSEWVGYRFAPGEGVFNRAFALNRQLVVEDYDAEPMRMQLLHGVGASVITPISVRGEHIGSLGVFFAKKGHRPSDAQLEIIRLLAGHAGTAVANARAYGAMSRGRALAQEVLDRLVDGVAVLDDAGNVTRWNRAAAELTGVLAGEVLGRPFPWRTGTRIEPAGHRLRDDCWMETIATALPESGASMVVMRDVSRHMALQETKALLFAMASHELRTPLTVIGGYARRLRDRLETMTLDEQRASVEAIMRKAGVLERTINQLLAGSMAELGRLEVDPEPIDIVPLLNAATAFLAGTTSSHRFLVDVEDGLPIVLADEHAVESVLTQLLENAVKYSPNGTTIRVRAVTGRDEVEVTVSDEGIGLRPGEEERVFDRFARGSSSVRGTGLGLFIVRRLVEALGGRVWARRHDGPGSSFSFSLPRS